MIEYLLAFLVFIMPVHSIPGLNFGGIISPVQVLEVIILYLTLSRWFLTKGAAGRPLTRPLAAILLLLIALAAVSMISLLWPNTGSNDYEIRRPLNFLEYFVLLALFILSPNKRRLLSLVSAAFTLSSATVIGLSILKSLGWITLPGLVRVSVRKLGPLALGRIALFDSADAYAAWTLPLLVAVLVWLSSPTLSWRVRWLLRLAFPVILLGVILNGSRSTWISVTITIPACVYAASRFGPRSLGPQAYTRLRPRRRWVRAALIVGFLLLVIKGRQLIDALVSLRPGTVSARLVGYWVALDLSRRAPHYLLFGAGKDRFVATMFASFYAEVVPHNFVLEQLVSDGIVGLGLLLVLLGLLLRLATRNIGYFARSQQWQLYRLSLYTFCSLVLILIHGMTSNIIPVYGLWVIVAMIVTLHGMGYLLRYSEYASVSDSTESDTAWGISVASYSIE